MKTLYLTIIGVSVICFSALGGGTVTNLTQANLEAALAGGGTVLFATNGTLTLTNTITIPVDTTLDAKSNQVIISGGNTVRLFQVASNTTFAVKGLVLADGHVVATTGDAFGACIWNQGGHVILTGCMLTNNSVQGADGTGGAAFGGAIYTVAGSLRMTNCLMKLNQVVGGTGSPPSGQPPTSTLGPGGPAEGGAIYAAGAMVILQAVEMNGNAATGGSPASPTAAYFVGRGGNGFGGALYAASPSIIYINSSLVLSNTAEGGVQPLAYSGGSPSGDGAGGGLFLFTNSSSDIRLTTFEHNSAVGGQGSYYPTGGGSGKGGHIFTAGNLQVWDSSFSNGRASGGSAPFPGVGRGGAICSTGGLTMHGCALFNDAASGGNAFENPSSGQPGVPGEGGALWSSGTLACTNTTIASSQAIGGSGGGARPGGAGTGGSLYLTNVTAVLVNLTVAASRADGTNLYQLPQFTGPALGGNLAAANATVTVLNSIIANSSGFGGDVWGSVTDGGYNICSDGTARFSAPGSLNQADPRLAALSDNGGPTPTMALLVGSPALDAIISGFPPVDQRSVSRPQGPAADIGAFEARANEIVIPPTQPPTQTFATLYTFTGISISYFNSDGAYPKSSLVMSGKTLYGTASGGGAANSGTVFALKSDGSGFRTLHSFAGNQMNTNSDGANPSGALLVSSNILYGTAQRGGSSGAGTVFAVNTDGTGFQNLHNFTGLSDGASPFAGLIISGNILYGTTSSGGSSGGGTVFALNTDGTGFTNLHSFTGTNNDGSQSTCALVLSGNTLYGTTQAGGRFGEGTVFALDTDGTGFQNLHNFTMRSNPMGGTNTDGANPSAGMILRNNTLYGTAVNGGSGGLGTVFALNTDGTSFRTLHSFAPNDGAYPFGRLILSGNILYGTAQRGGSSSSGTVFAVNADGTSFRTLYNFAASSANSDGAWPSGGLVSSGSILYGTTYFGGVSGNGTVFSISLPVTPPQLTITSSGLSVIVTWPTNYTGFTLQATTNLVSSVWTTNLPASVVNGQYTITNPISAASQFYRLRQ